MTNIKRRIKKRNESLRDLERYTDTANNTFLIHYSSESFFDLDDGKSARITSIAVRSYDTGQSESFTIHKTAEKIGLLENIEEHYNTLEKKMIEEFFKFVKNHKQAKWIHWNMRDTAYGFQAINHRYTVLGGRSEPIPDENKYDLADKLKDIYGSQYIKTNPRFKVLVEKNNISTLNFLTGTEEVAAFKNKEFVKLHHSTLRKVNMMHSICEKTLDRDLKTDSTMKEVYGLTFTGIHHAAKESWILSLAWSLLMVILGILGGVYANTLMN